MLTKCRAHLSEARESYFEHLAFAASVGLMLVSAGLACIIHAVVPSYCTRTASKTVGRLTQLFVDRQALAGAIDDTSGALTLVGLVGLAAPPSLILLLNPGGTSVAVAAAVFAGAIPCAYLWTNPELDPVE